jgi:hypothetical protein
LIARHQKPGDGPNDEAEQCPADDVEYGAHVGCLQLKPRRFLPQSSTARETAVFVMQLGIAVGDQ